ncbi:MAG: hypothetical protein F6K37_20190 [Moorea sp. SIO4E2]|uniref:hypothetical protein n=1 Tax=Moorena sp. SIO4E2 TaxID=2607826 RepID=UPI0013BBFAC6|nr:hypothetical protein [Moorena sp. SIO4E2]NEQ08181.1 hypothetical protein [Moorena sp. SIO4E2]
MSKQPINEYGQFVRGSLHKVEVYVNDTAKQTEEYTYKLKKQTDTDSYTSLKQEDTLEYDDGTVARQQSYIYNSRDQIQEVVESAYDYQQDNVTVDTFHIQHTKYLWENFQDQPDHEIFQRNMLSLPDESIRITAEGNPDAVKSQTGQKYIYIDTNNSYYQQELLVSISSDPRDWGDENWRKVEEVEERDPQTKFPILKSLHGLNQSGTEAPSYTRIIPAVVDSDSRRSRDKVVATVVSKSDRDFFYLPIAKYEEHYLDEGVWSITNGAIIANTNSKFRNNVVTSVSGEYRIAFLKTGDLSSEKKYVICGWINPGNNGINLVMNGETIPLTDETGDVWVYFETPIEEGSSQLEIVGNPLSMVDYLWIAAVDCDFSINAFSNSLDEHIATIRKNGLVDYRIYNDRNSLCDRFTMSSEGKIFDYEISLFSFSRFDNHAIYPAAAQTGDFDPAHPNYSLQISFVEDGFYLPNFSLASLNTAEFGLKVQNFNYGNDEFGIVALDQDNQLLFSLTFVKNTEQPLRQGYYTFTTANDETLKTPLELAAREWLLVVTRGVFFFFGDGKLLLSSKTVDFTAATSVNLGPYNTSEFRDAFVFKKPVISTIFIDSKGRARQAQSLSIDYETEKLTDVVIKEFIYDGFGHQIIVTKNAKASSRDEELFAFRDNFIDDIQDNGFLTGELKDLLLDMDFGDFDTSLPYVRFAYDGLLNRNTLDTLRQGFPYNFNSDYQKDSSYNGEAELNELRAAGGIPSTRPLRGITQKVPLDGEQKIHYSFLSGAQGEFLVSQIKLDDNNKIVWKNQSQWENSQQVLKTLAPQDGLESTVTVANSDRRQIEWQDPDQSGTTYVIKDYFNRIRFTNDADERKWRYFKYDQLGRVCEVGILKDVDTMPPGEVPNYLLDRANNTDYPSTSSEGESLTEYYYDMDDFREGYDD